jgi:hypothetical protein
VIEGEGTLSLSRELVGAMAQELRCLPKVTTVSKQEAVRMLASDIEALKAQGYTYRDILLILQERGLEIASVDTLKNYLHRAKRRAERQAGGVVVKPHALRAAPHSSSGPLAIASGARPPATTQHASAPISTPEHMVPCPAPSSSAPASSLPQKAGWFTPVLHTVDDDV